MNTQQSTLSVVGLDFIAFKSNKEPLNNYVYRLANGKPNIMRTTKEFLYDLKQSGLIDDDVQSRNHPSVRKIIMHLKQAPFTITGAIKFCKKGDLWTVTANSGAVKDPANKHYGKVKEGDKLPYEEDMRIVEDGFLSIRVSNSTLRLIQEGFIYESEVSKMFGTSQDTASVSDSSASNEFDDDHSTPVDDDIIRQAQETTAEQPAKPAKQ